MYINSKTKNELISQVKKLFRKNLISGYSNWKNTDFKFIAPASKEYVYQFLWDTCFHAIVLSNFDTNWAKDEIKNHLKAQWTDGFIPHIIFWKGNVTSFPHWAFVESKPSLHPKTSALTQPPVIGIAVEEIYNKSPDKKFLKEVLPKISLYLKWLLKNRDPDKDGLISIISPNESGMDELPVFQIVSGYNGDNLTQLHWAYRKPDMLNQFYQFNSAKILEKDYFNVEELLFNTIFIECCHSISRLFKKIENYREAEFFEKIAAKSEKSLFKKCWSSEDDLFYTIYSKNESKVFVNTIASLMPLYLSNLPQEKAEALIKNHLLNTEEYWTNYPVPTVAKNEIYYSPIEFPDFPAQLPSKILNKAYITFYRELKMLWRGPVWMATNWFIVKGLRKHGFDKIADNIVDKTIDMVKKSGFREYYNPENGDGYRREDFGWSTLIIDLL